MTDSSAQGKPGDWRRNEHFAFLNRPVKSHQKVTYSTGPRDAVEGWREQANCGPTNAELFDAPDAGGLTVSPTDVDRYRCAAILCESCPVIALCKQDPSTQQSEGFRHGELWLREYRNGVTRLVRRDPFKPGTAPRRPKIIRPEQAA